MRLARRVAEGDDRETVLGDLEIPEAANPRDEVALIPCCVSFGDAVPLGGDPGELPAANRSLGEIRIHEAAPGMRMSFADAARVAGDADPNAFVSTHKNSCG